MPFTFNEYLNFHRSEKCLQKPVTTYLTIDRKKPRSKCYNFGRGILCLCGSFFELFFHLFNKLRKLFLTLLTCFGIYVPAYTSAVYTRGISSFVQMLINFGYTTRPRFANFGLVELKRRFFCFFRLTFRLWYLGVRTADTAVDFHRRLLFCRHMP